VYRKIEMKTVTLFIVLSLLFLMYSLMEESFGQTVYEVTPGTKGNRIILSLANISEIKNAKDVSVKLSVPSANLTFSKNEEVIKNIEAGRETEAAFSFDIKRDARVNTIDTIEFRITDGKTIFLTKQFILSFSPPKEYRLEQNYPNPFNPVTTILYQLPADSKVTLKVYDILGSEAAELVNEVQSAGYKEVKFGGSIYSSGVYIYRLTAESVNGSMPAGRAGYSSIKKMIMIK
jgi:hypothetical protein